MTLLSKESADAAEDAELERRRRVIDAAAELLATHGPQGLTLRRLAGDVGASTQLIYSLFGGKAGLADALYAEGFARLASGTRAALEQAAPPGDPERIVAIGTAYCDFARANPALFAVMFGRAIPGFAPRTATRRACRDATLGLVVRAAQECLDAGTLRADDADSLAQACWTATHGVASLLVTGHLADDEQTLRALLLMPIRAYRSERGTAPA